MSHDWSATSARLIHADALPMKLLQGESLMPETETSTRLIVDKEIEAALAPLEEFERLFVLQKVSENIAFQLYYQVEEWRDFELESASCDMAKVERRTKSARLLKALANK